jgi:hypothetical protein
MQFTRAQAVSLVLYSSAFKHLISLVAKRRTILVLIASKREREGWEAREGAIFMEITSAKDKNVYDWENKIVMALSTNDMGKLLLTLATGNECNIMHDPGAKSDNAGAVKKYLNVTSPKGTAEGVLLCCSQSAGGQTKKHMVPLAGDEVMVLRQLLQSAVSKSLGW